MSMFVPRAVSTKIDPSGMAANCAAPIIPALSGECGKCIETTSDCASSSSNEAHRSIPKASSAPFGR